MLPSTVVRVPNLPRCFALGTSLSKVFELFDAWDQRGRKTVPRGFHHVSAILLYLPTDKNFRLGYLAEGTRKRGEN